MMVRPNNISRLDAWHCSQNGDSLAADAFVTYGNSRMKLEDDRAGMEYYGQQQRQIGKEEGREEGREEGIIRGLKIAIDGLKRKGMSLLDAIDLLGLPASEIEPLWNA